VDFVGVNCQRDFSLTNGDWKWRSEGTFSKFKSKCNRVKKNGMDIRTACEDIGIGELVVSDRYSDRWYVHPMITRRIPIISRRFDDNASIGNCRTKRKRVSPRELLFHRWRNIYVAYTITRYDLFGRVAFPAVENKTAQLYDSSNTCLRL